MPSPEQTGSSIVSLRLSDALLDRLDRYRDGMEVHQHENVSRNQAMRLALTQWLADQEAQEGMIHPDLLRQHVRNAYTSVRSTQERVDMYRLRRLLNWPSHRFEALLEQRRAESHVVLHIGDASGGSDAERRHSYEVNSQLYVTLSWQDGTVIKCWLFTHGKSDPTTGVIGGVTGCKIDVLQHFNGAV